MAPPLSLKFPFMSPPPMPPTLASYASAQLALKPPSRVCLTATLLSPKSRTQIRTTTNTTRAVEESQGSAESGTQEGEQEEPTSEPAESSVELSELGAEIKKAMEQRKEKSKEGEHLLSGVGEEIREIEWPVFGKVLGTTGVVLGVIAGSSVVLLTVNAVLAELSDKVFAGKGIQNFFG